MFEHEQRWAYANGIYNFHRRIYKRKENSFKGRRKKDAVVEFDPNGKTYEKAIGYHSTLGSAIGAIAKQKTPKNVSFSSLKDYMDELKAINQETQNLINKINL